MSNYLSYNFHDDEAFISTFDELPLWSAHFGILLLKHLELKPSLKVVDIGSGAGFPLIEIAERLGNSSHIYGIDPWKNANIRARQKIKNYGLNNVEIIEESAVKMPFENNFIDLIISNLGINNFENPQSVFQECSRVLKPGGRLALTSNLYGHWKSFYQIFYETLQSMEKTALLEVLKKDETHRSTVSGITEMFNKSGFKITRCFEETFEMKFLDGRAFLNHHFIKLGWLTTWKNIFPENELKEIFSALEQNLNHHSKLNGSLNLTVPMIFIEGEKL